MKLTSNITFSLPGQKPVIITTTNNTATITTTVTTDYIKNVLGVREQNIRIYATSNNPNIIINEINTKLGVQKAPTTLTITPTKAEIAQETIFRVKVNTPTNLNITKGTITVTDEKGNIIGTGNVNNNQITMTTTFNQAGTIKITAAYNGTVHYADSNRQLI